MNMQRRMIRMIRQRKTNTVLFVQKYFTTMTQLYKDFQEKHDDEKNGSDCCFTNHKLFLDLEKEKKNELMMTILTN